MNPDRLFNYLDGRLAPHERAAVEEELMNDEQARREFEVARRIHHGMQTGATERPEIFPAVAEDAGGRKRGRQILTAAIFLVALNVAFGLYIIARHESANPNREALRRQSVEQMQRALEKASSEELTPAVLSANVTINVLPGMTGLVSEQAATLAGQAGGSATNGTAAGGKTGMLVEVPSGRASEFIKALPTLRGVKNVAGGAERFAPNEKVALQLELIEQSP